MQNLGIHSVPYLMLFKTRLLLITIKVLINTVQKLLSSLEFLISFSKYFKVLCKTLQLSTCAKLSFLNIDLST